MFNKFLNRSKSPTTTSQEEKQGFICPECKKEFVSVEELSEHHISSHPVLTPGNSSDVNVDVTSLVSDDRTAQLKHDIADLNASLQEESWYAAELQKELQRVNEENEKLKGKVKNVKDFDDISKKAADLAVVIAEISADLDEERSKNVSLTQQLNDAQKTTEELCQSQMSLQAKLNQYTTTDDVEVLKQELAKSQVQLDSILVASEKDTVNLKSQVATMQEDYTRLQEKLENKEKSLEKYFEENKTLSSDLTRLETQLGFLKEEKTQLESTITSLNVRVSDLQDSNTRLAEDVKRKDDEKNNMLNRLNNFNETLSLINSQKAGDNLDNEMRQLASNFTDFKSTLQDKEKRNSELEEQINYLSKDLSALKEARILLESQLTSSTENNASLTSKMSSLEDKINKKEEFIKEQQEEMTALKLREQALGLQLTDTKKELESRVCELTNQIEEQEKENAANSKQQCQEMYELDHKLTALRSESSKVSLEYEKLRSSQEEWEGAKSALEKDRSELQRVVDENEVKLEELMTVNDTLKLSFADATKAKEELQDEVESLQKQLEVSAGCIQELNARIETKDERLLELNNKTQKLEAEIAKPCTMCTNYENQLNKQHLELQETQTNLKTSLASCETLDREVKNYRCVIEANTDKINELECNLEAERENAINTENLLQSLKLELEEYQEESNIRIKLLDEELTRAKQENLSNEAINKDLLEFKTRLEDELQEAERALTESNTLHAQELEDLTNKNAVLISHKMALHEELQVQTDHVEQLTAQLAVAKEKSNEIREEFENSLKLNQKNLIIAESKITQLSDDVSRLTVKHEDEMRDMTVKLYGAEQEIRDSQGVIEECNKECERLHAKVNATEATMENLIDERKIIHKRLLESEEKLTKLKEENIKLMDDYEKTSTALNELAQEHSHLIYVQGKKANRKWEDDGEVENCKTCFKQFSVALRRHHCRNCGGIFCDNCTKHKSSTPASKAKVRVCGPCFKELNPA